MISYRSGPYTEGTGEYVRNGGRYALATAVLDTIVLVFAIVIAFLLRFVEISFNRSMKKLSLVEHRIYFLFDNNVFYVMILVIINPMKMLIQKEIILYFLI